MASKPKRPIRQTPYMKLESILKITNRETNIVNGYIRTLESISKILIPTEISQLCFTYYYDTTHIASLIVETGTTKILNSSIIHTFKSIIIKQRGTLTTKPWNFESNKGGILLLKCSNDIIIEDNGCIHTNGKGYYEETYYHDQRRKSQRGNYGTGSDGTSAKFSTGGGGSYGTKGCCGQYHSYGEVDWAGQPGKIYGDKFLKQFHLGSSGGGVPANQTWWSSSKSGGNGGGAIYIQCKRLIMCGNHARIVSNGIDGSEDGAAGSGGSIYIDVQDKLLFNDTAKIQAIGGKACAPRQFGSVKCVDGAKNIGRGGNGRIRIQFRNKKQMETNRFDDNTYPAPFVG